MAEREKITVTESFQLDYETLLDIAKRCGGWLRSSGGRDGDESAEVWIDDKTYVFVGKGLVEFLYFIKNVGNDRISQALALIAYIEKSADQPPSVFVRDAIVARAKKCQADWEAEASDPPRRDGP